MGTRSKSEIRNPQSKIKMKPTRELQYLPKVPLASITTDTGCVREANEDSGTHVKPGDAEIKKTRGTLTVVADGMGGHASGEIAAQMAIGIYWVWRLLA